MCFCGLVCVCVCAHVFCKLLPTLTTCLQVYFNIILKRQNETSQTRDYNGKSNSFLNEDDEVGTILLGAVSEFKT